MVKILVVDDEADLEVLIKQKFRQKIREQQYEFAFAINGRHALEQLEQHSNVDVVLSDINMPNMNGIEFLREKANRPAIKDVPVFMISTETGEDIIGEAKSLGAVGALKKPFTPEKVNEVLGPLM